MAVDTVAFYIKNYIANGSIVTTETKFQAVPFSGDPVISNPHAKIELGKAGSFEFEVDPTSPYYNAFQQMKTLIRIEYFGNQIFRGRVLTIDRKMQGTRTIHCEGDFAFLLDSHQIGTKEDTRPEIGVLAYLQEIITQHNTDMDTDVDKKFALGDVPGQYSASVADSQKVNIPADKASQKFGDTSWNTSMDRIEGLLSDFGGYFRTRYNTTDGYIYLDWFDNFYNPNLNTQTIEVAKNLIDLSGTTEVENLFTIVIPIGKDKSGNNVFISDYWPIVDSTHDKVNYITVPELASVPLYTDAELNSQYHKKADYQNAIAKFGAIWKPVDFENADTPEKLFAYAKDWMKNNFMPEVTQWSVSAVDLKIVDPNKQYLLCGDLVNLVHPEVSRVFEGFTIISAEYAFFDPKNNKYTIGIPNSEINASYGTKTKSKGGGGGGGLSDHNDDDGEAAKLAADLLKLQQTLNTQYYMKTHGGEDITLDNPLAYQVYNTDVTQKDKNQALKDLMTTSEALLWTKKTRYDELLAEALIRGVSVDDTQLLIDFTPSEKQKQTAFRNQTAYYMVNTVGVDQQVAQTLLHETASQSYFASLVDDNGDWTPYAVSQGATMWNDSAHLKEQAFNTRRTLNGKELPNTTMEDASKFVNNLMESLGISENLNVSDILDVEKIESGIQGCTDKLASLLGGGITFKITNKQGTSTPTTWEETKADILGIFTSNNTEDDGKEFTLESDTAQVDGVNGKAKFGKDSNNNWHVKLNETVTYVDENGQTQTSPYFVCADDFKIPSVDSFKTKLLVVDTLIAGKASIGELNAAVARIQNLETDAITTTKLASLTVNCASILTTYGVTAQGNLSGATLSVGGHGAVWSNLTYIESISLSLTNSHKFEDTDTGQIITGKLVTSYSSQSRTKYMLVRNTTPD